LDSNVAHRQLFSEFFSGLLEAFIDETIRLAKSRGYNPTVFIGMRGQQGTIEAIERLVQSGDLQSGFKRLLQLGLLDWTIEAAVTKFPDEFTRHARECSAWRLGQVKKAGK
jgi:hypothetical protein